MQIKFAHTRFKYDSYTDMRKLIDLSPQFEQCFIDEIRPSHDTVYIIYCVNGEFRPHMDNWRKETKNSKVCIWVLERPCGEQRNAAQKYKEFIDGNLKLLNDGYADELWMSDKQMAKEHNDSRIVFIPMGSHSGLFNSPYAWDIWGGNKKWDFIHLSYLTHRRSLVLDRFKENKMREKSNCWGDERSDGLRNTKFMINIHQDVHPINEPLRIALAAAAGIPYISETIVDPFPMIPNEHFLQVEWENSVKKILEFHKQDYRPYAEMGKRFHNLMCNEYQFGKSIIEHCRSRQWISS